jgi:hypothetical protein
MAMEEALCTNVNIKIFIIKKQSIVKFVKVQCTSEFYQNNEINFPKNLPLGKNGLF